MKVMEWGVRWAVEARRKGRGEEQEPRRQQEQEQRRQDEHEQREQQEQRNGGRNRKSNGGRQSKGKTQDRSKVSKASKCVRHHLSLFTHVSMNAIFVFAPSSQQKSFQRSRKGTLFSCWKQ